ncbi:flagellar basal-body rod protein FlgG [Bradyrhizobium yuanmingense]
MQALHTAATGMAAQELNVQVISNNIANLRTTGFKKQTAAFQDLIYEHVRRVGAQSSDQGTILPVGVDIGGGVKTVGTPRSMTQGTLSQTGNDLDLAISGEGFFKILMPDGTFQYTRDGTFQMDNQGRVVTAQGNPVQPTITIPNNASGISVSEQGQVSVTLPGSTTSSIVGQIGVTRFINKAGLQPVGNNQFTETPSSGRAAGRHREHRRLRQAHARQPRAGQCRCRLGDERPDRRPARLRDERQGDQRRRPDDAIDHGAVPLR